MLPLPSCHSHPCSSQLSSSSATLLFLFTRVLARRSPFLLFLPTPHFLLHLLAALRCYLLTTTMLLLPIAPFLLLLLPFAHVPTCHAPPPPNAPFLFLPIMPPLPPHCDGAPLLYPFNFLLFLTIACYHNLLATKLLLFVVPPSSSSSSSSPPLTALFLLPAPPSSSSSPHAVTTSSPLAFSLVDLFTLCLPAPLLLGSSTFGGNPAIGFGRGTRTQKKSKKEPGQNRARSRPRPDPCMAQHVHVPSAGALPRRARSPARVRAQCTGMAPTEVSIPPRGIR